MKDRFTLIDGKYPSIIDNTDNKLYDPLDCSVIMNRQHEEIAFLKEENKILKQSISKYNDNSIVPSINNFAIATDEMRYEILCEIVERLKQYKFQLQELPKKICDEIRKYTTNTPLNELADEVGVDLGISKNRLSQVLDEIQAKYEGEN